MQRRLLVYLLLDCSKSMDGEPIRAVYQGVKALVSKLKADPMSLESCYISIVRLGEQAEQIVPLTGIMEFQMPNLDIGGELVLTEALNCLKNCLDKDVQLPSSTFKGDFRAWALILICGQLVDFWREAANHLKKQDLADILLLVGGSQADEQQYKGLTKSVLKLALFNQIALEASYTRSLSQCDLILGQS